jgi:hypothetical protein
VKGSGPTRITLQFRTFEINRVAVNKPLLKIYYPTAGSSVTFHPSRWSLLV